MMRNILYGRTPESLAEAFAIAHTVHYDQQYTESQEFQNRSQQKQNSSKFNSNANYNRPIQTSTQPRFTNKLEEKPVTMNENKRENWRQPNQQQSNRVQKINRIQESESNSNNSYDGDLCDTIPDDLISNTTHESDKSNTASTFLSE